MTDAGRVSTGEVKISGKGERGGGVRKKKGKEVIGIEEKESGKEGKGRVRR